jgi:CSLREA domain-containing protein
MAFLGFIAIFALAADAATFTVTKVADTNDGVCDSDCSLREAIAAANAAAGDDTIEFDAGLFSDPATIVLSSGEMTIGVNGLVTINGPGPGVLTLDGNLASRIMTVGPGATANITGLTFTRGNGSGALNTGRGGALYVAGGTAIVTNSVFTGNSAANGGAFNNAASGTPATATYINCVFSNNSSTSTGGAGQNFSTSFLTIHNSTFTGNSGGTTTGGGALQANGQVRITNSTFSGNTATAGAGGAIQSNGSLLVLTNVTIVGNNSATNGGGLHRGTTNVNGFVRNSIIAGNNGTAASPDVTNSGGGLVSQGNNLIGTVGTSTGWVKSDLINTAARVTPIGDHGGLGMTFALLGDSPARNAGQNCVLDLSCSANNPDLAVTTDQRGAARPFNTTVDIGAFEESTAYTAVLPEADAGQPYSEVIAPDGGTFNYSVTSGSLPPGLSLGETVLSPYGGKAVPEGGTVLISGTPTTPGTYNFTITISETAVGNASASVNYQITVPGLAANVSISGRIRDGGLSTVPNAIVSITDGSTTWTTRSNSFGVYSFEGLPANVQYTITVIAKGYTYAPVQVTPSGDVTNLDISPSS